MTSSQIRTKEGDLGGAQFVIRHDELSGLVSVTVERSYGAGVPPNTAAKVWDIVSDFGGLKIIFPSLVRVYLSYPDANDTQIGLVRDMSFAPAPGSQNLSTGIEQLIALDPVARRLTYVSVLGLPIADYHSEMRVKGDDASVLIWHSTGKIAPKDAGFLDILANILAEGANQIAKHLGID